MPDNICICNTGVEDNIHYLLKCPRYAFQRQKLFDLAYPIISKLNEMSLFEDSNLVKILLYGESRLNVYDNSRILKASIYFILNSKRFAQDYP